MEKVTKSKAKREFDEKWAVWSAHKKTCRACITRNKCVTGEPLKDATLRSVRIAWYED